MSEEQETDQYSFTQAKLDAFLEERREKINDAYALFERSLIKTGKDMNEVFRKTDELFNDFREKKKVETHDLVLLSHYLAKTIAYSQYTAKILKLQSDVTRKFLAEDARFFSALFSQTVPFIRREIKEKTEQAKELNLNVEEGIQKEMKLWFAGQESMRKRMKDYVT